MWFVWPRDYSSINDFSTSVMSSISNFPVQYQGSMNTLKVHNTSRKQNKTFLLAYTAVEPRYFEHSGETKKVRNNATSKKPIVND